MVILLLSFCVISNHSTVFGASAMWQAYDGWQGYKNKHIPTLYFLRSYSLVTASSSSEESAGLVKVKVLVAQSCLALCNPMDYNQPGSSVHGILQPRMLRWVAIPFSRGSSPPRKRAWVSQIAGRFFTIWATRETYKFNMQVYHGNLIEMHGLGQFLW